MQRETGCDLARSVHSSHKAMNFGHDFVSAEVVTIAVDVYYYSGGVQLRGQVAPLLERSGGEGEDKRIHTRLVLHVRTD